MTEIYFLIVWRLEIQDQVLANLVSGESSLTGLQMSAFLLSPHMAFLLCVPSWGEYKLSGVLSYKDNNPYDLI